MNIGEMIRNSDGSMTGYIAEATYDFENVFLDNVASTHERAPAFNLMTRSPRGRPVRIGSLWERVAKETGEVYFGGYVQSSASGFVPLRLFRSRQNPDLWNVVRKLPQRKASGAQEVEIPETEIDRSADYERAFSRELEDA
jgi:uncharacterized protein (DUF736 family)